MDHPAANNPPSLRTPRAQTKSRRPALIGALVVGPALIVALVIAVVLAAGSLFAAAQDEPPAEGVTIFRLFSEPSEDIGGSVAAGTNGSEWVDEQLEVDVLPGERIQVLIRDNEFSDNINAPVFRLVFGPEPGGSLTPGGYLNARQSDYATRPAPELQFERIEGDPPRLICSRSFGMFEVLEIEYDNSGALASFAADFQFSCATAGEGPWSLGSVRYNSTVPQDYDIEDDFPVLSGTVRGPDGRPLRSVLVCTGLRNQIPLQTISAGPPGGPAPCQFTESDGSYAIEVDIGRTTLGEGYGEFYLFYFPTEYMYLRQECTGDHGPTACLIVDMINVTRGVHVNSNFDVQLEYGCWIRQATIIGSPEGGLIEGTEGDDVIVSFDGDDAIFGRGGDDFICPGNGTNTVYAGDGNDLIGGGNADDFLSGQNGDDFIWGGRGDDTLRGGNDEDELRGDAGNDDIHGGRGRDELAGDSGDDIVRGGTGDDQVQGGSGNDFVNGNGGVDIVNGGSGDDRLVAGGPRGDTVNGGDGDDLVKGLGGADSVSGGAGNDDVRGGKGTDSVNGGDGFDNCNGGDGLSDRTIDCEIVVNATPIDPAPAPVPTATPQPTPEPMPEPPPPVTPEPTVAPAPTPEPTATPEPAATTTPEATPESASTSG